MTLSLFDVFTGLAIFISCLGLYGLVSLITLRPGGDGVPDPPGGDEEPGGGFEE